MKRVFKGKLLKVYVMRRRLPNGYRGTFELIRHPGAVLIVPFLSRERIVMLRQLRPVIGGYIYELPAGTLDPRERPAACARREIVEETAHRAGRLTYLGKIHPVPGYSTELIHIYKAERLKKVDGHTPEADEVITQEIMTRSRVRRLFRGGKLTDAKTIAALAMCKWL